MTSCKPRVSSRAALPAPCARLVRRRTSIAPHSIHAAVSSNSGSVVPTFLLMAICAVALGVLGVYSYLVNKHGSVSGTTTPKQSSVDPIHSDAEEEDHHI